MSSGPAAATREPASPPTARSVEWPTVALAVAVHGGWITLTLGHRFIPTALLIVLLSIWGAWFISLQHEVLHGHPFRSRRANDALGWPPLHLWLPYAEYKASHLRHHRNEVLTDPIEDPESYYMTGQSWADTPGWLKVLRRANRTLLGRVTVGPALSMAGWAHDQMRRAPGSPKIVDAERLRRQRARTRRIWAWHLVGVAGVLAYLVLVAHLPLWIYLLGYVYGGLGLAQVRSFAEHRYVAGTASRSAVVDAGPLWALLFLNNNLHDAHHERPHAAWYHLPRLAVQLDSRRRAAEGAGLYSGYTEVFRRFGLRAFTPPVHPLYELGVASSRADVTAALAAGAAGAATAGAVDGGR